MKKNVIYAMLLLFTVVLSSCKKEDALSRIDPNSTDVQMTAAGDQPTAATPEQPTITTTPPPSNGKFPVMTLNKKEHSFGDIKEGEKPETTFTFTNTGEADLIISNASGSCGCTVPEYPKEPIKPGKTGKLKVSFDSTGKPGMQQKSVTITCNTQQGTDVLTIKANVIPKPVSTTENQ
ncbi:DUF1573 domain-containing protein [Flavobacterium orientale]|uniref:DUF1573 domain-containing protein n=1 Tax=Flavobacterium orientale TaxID=1756020 RepID=A0A917DFM2_9FLAO|nr:DUF1573 domain-containing protein [Flavobacterium orientale]GGD33127.1 hypothetical protein GCM10011343_23920 [Flavobacterium orientale]